MNTNGSGNDWRKHWAMPVTIDDLKDLFRYRPIGNDDLMKDDHIRMAGFLLAKAILEDVPECADRDFAIQCVRLSVLWARESILNG